MEEYYSKIRFNLANNYLFKVNNRNMKTRCEICGKIINSENEKYKFEIVTVQKNEKKS